MVYLLKMVVFHGYVSHTQMVVVWVNLRETKAAPMPNNPKETQKTNKYEVQLGATNTPKTNMFGFMHLKHIYSVFSETSERNHELTHNLISPDTPVTTSCEDLDLRVAQIRGTKKQHLLCKIWGPPLWEVI